MKDFRKPIRVAEAIERIVRHVSVAPAESVHLLDSVGRVMGESIYASHPIPAFRRSAYDGFAVRAEDIEAASVQNPIFLKVVSAIAAEEHYDLPLNPGEAVRIMTGSRVPAGADAVVMFEIVQQGQDADEIVITKPHPSGANISEEGEDIQKDALMIRKGEMLTAGKIAVLATFGYAEFPVGRRPKVGIFASGNELAEPGTEKIADQIMNSNAYMVYHQVKKLGGDPVYFGILQDDLDIYVKSFSEALKTCDFIISTGGVSMGDYDFTLAAHEKLGAELLFHKISMRPGSVTSASVLDGKILFGLSGNPSACFVGTEVYVQTAIRKFMGCEAVYPYHTTAILSEDFLKMNPYTRFVRANYAYKDQKIFVRPSGRDKSNMVSSLLDANALMILPGGTKGFQAGDVVSIIPLDCQEGSEDFCQRLFKS